MDSSDSSDDDESMSLSELLAQGKRQVAHTAAELIGVPKRTVVSLSGSQQERRQQPPSPHEERQQPSNEFHFPFDPYDIQTQLMKQMLTTIDNRHVGIFESPTGTVSPRCCRLAYPAHTTILPAGQIAQSHMWRTYVAETDGGRFLGRGRI
jgi:hypothetical protein